jgi:hypothetical protein
MQHKILTLIIATLIPGLSAAQDDSKFECTMGDLTRRVEIVSEPGVSVPCEVHYFKDSEAPGEQQVLWRALNEQGYCEARTSEFIASLGEMGWDCGAASSDAGMQDEAAEPVESDDTADLAPAVDVESDES